MPESDIGTQFGMLLDSKENTDIIINVSNENFHVHKLVLAARSPVLHLKLFGEPAVENTVLAINNLEPKVFKVK